MSFDACPAAPARDPPKLFRIFLAAPADVAHERSIVRDVVDRLRMEPAIGERLDPQLVAWDMPDVDGTAAAPPTDEAAAGGLPLPAQCDVAVVVLWASMGAALPQEGGTSGGPSRLSAAEWAYRNALVGFRDSGRPVAWLFHRRPAPKVDLDDPRLDEAREHLRRVNAFIRGLRNPDGSIGGGVRSYSAPDEFRCRFEQLLRQELEAVIADMDATAAMPVHPESAAAERARPDVAEIDQLLTLLADAKVRFVAVIGHAGCSRASLVTAGLAARLREGLIGAAPWRDLRVALTERGRDPVLALAEAIVEMSGVAAGTAAGTAAGLAADLRAEPGRLALLAQRLLQGRANGAELLVVVDRLEELFAYADPTSTAAFVDLLVRAAETPRVRVVTTLRADFYAAAIGQPKLAALLRRDRGSFPLDPSAGPTPGLADPGVVDGSGLGKAGGEAEERSGLRTARGRMWRAMLPAAAGLAALAIGLGLWRGFGESAGYPQILMLKARAIELGLGRLPEPFRLLPDPDMLRIAGGSFEMGDVAGVGADAERPVHRRSVPAFRIGRYEVTFDEYDLFAAATGRPLPGDEGWGRGRLPVINVSWNDAVAYADWLGRHTGRQYRLPTEVEWEYAARGGTSGARWFAESAGAAETCRFMNGQDRTLDESAFWSDATKQQYASEGLYRPVDCADGYAQAAPVDARTFAANPFGLFHALGNVWEWVGDCVYDYGAVPDAAVAGVAPVETGGACTARLLRGGAWDFEPGFLRASARHWYAPDYAAYDVGLRLAAND